VGGDRQVGGPPAPMPPIHLFYHMATLQLPHVEGEWGRKKEEGKEGGGQERVLQTYPPATNSSLATSYGTTCLLFWEEERIALPPYH